jgi:tRNA dimethylallyltransferase
MSAAPQELPVIAIAGPTASGKTAAALAVAARWPVEIVSVDSALVYRGMDIGTAKPGRAERDQVPHHLIDILDPAQAYSAARFAADARRLISEIRARDHTPLLVGGTMLYLKALADGLDPLPAADAAVRATLDERALREGWPALHAELQRVDPATAARLAPHDAQRIQRALEVWQLSGRPLSSHYRNATQRNAPESLTIISLEPQDRAWLHARIAQRFDVMLAHGFIDEVLALRARGDLSPQMPSMRCVGYRQAWEALDAGDLVPLRERGVAATRQLAKRQLTWLRSMPARRVVACDADSAVDRVIDKVALRWAQTARC